MKKCKDCGLTKQLDQFWKAKQNTDQHQGVCKDCKAKRWTKQKRSERLAYRYGAYINSSKRRKSRAELEFNLTIEQFDALTSQTCHYCDCYSPDKQFCGVDRVDDTLGYTPDNCVSCCSICNFMKRNMSKVDFLTHITKIYTKSI